MVSKRILDELAGHPYRIADALNIHVHTVYRWVAYLKGTNGSFRPCRPQNRVRDALARTLGISRPEVDEAFALKEQR